eukprot:TRINITY_DN30254_c0_g1_i1.p1 TRINITY_DN30254_c0_g1~~TRINITY_DN30254_c0_g1_i1.p1  ORF type:complete len:405 (-),score=103.36 TRINITY_DN30254_c0_g1_i1:93-1271(-)
MSDSNSGGPLPYFMAVTGASKEQSLGYLDKAKGDMDAAVALFFDDKESGRIAEPQPEAAGAGGEGQSSNIDAILGHAKDGSAKDASDATKGAGKGSGKGGSESEVVRTVGIVFFADGFMVDENFEENLAAPAEEAAAEAAPAPAPRRTGMASLSDFQQPSGGRPRGPMPKLPKLTPLRSYDTAENEAFLGKIKAGRTPEELQTRDPTGQPIPVSIAVSDLRPKTYKELEEALKQMEQMMKGQEQSSSAGSSGKPAPSAPAMFTGAGHTLSSSAAPGSSAPCAPGSGGGSAGADPSLIELVTNGSEPVADESKPTTTLQIRLASGARVKVKLNLDHKVSDLWHVVAHQMGLEAFKSASNHELAAGFPPKPLTKLTATLAEADLANASVVHRCR